MAQYSSDLYLIISPLTMHHDHNLSQKQVKSSRPIDEEIFFRLIQFDDHMSNVHFRAPQGLKS